MLDTNVINEFQKYLTQTRLLGCNAACVNRDYRGNCRLKTVFIKPDSSCNDFEKIEPKFQAGGTIEK